MKLTKEYIESCVEEKHTMTLGNKTTMVLLRLKNGFEVTGTSSCVDPADYSQEVGEPIALQRAMDKVWELEGYLLQNMPRTAGIAESVNPAPLP